MDAAALDQRTRTHRDGVPPDLVERLLDLGHADLVREQALAEDGDWYCARAWARRLAGQGRTDEALAVVARYTATGWFTAVAEAARLLDATGRGEEAIGMLRPFAAAGERSALAELAPLLARHGRAEEAYALLVPHIADWYLAEALADVALVLGRGDEVAERLAARTAPDRPCGRCGGPNAPGAAPSRSTRSTSSRPSASGRAVRERRSRCCTSTARPRSTTGTRSPNSS